MILQNKVVIRTQFYIIICSSWYASNTFSPSPTKAVQLTQPCLSLSQNPARVTGRSHRWTSETRDQTLMAWSTLCSYQTVNIKLYLHISWYLHHIWENALDTSGAQVYCSSVFRRGKGSFPISNVRGNTINSRWLLVTGISQLTGDIRHQTVIHCPVTKCMQTCRVSRFSS